ncbi:CobS protein [Candidatus Burkholderia brachyanthoides]|nr:CobS protein [Candidatus Burkholderia brachyanthoides]
MHDEADPYIGVYERPPGAPSEWWRVSMSEREHMYCIEHGGTQGRVNIDTVVDLDNLRAKLHKSHREDFMMRLRRAVEAAPAPQVDEPSVIVGDMAIAQGAGGPLVPAVNRAYLFTDRANDVLRDIVETSV